MKMFTQKQLQTLRLKFATLMCLLFANAANAQNFDSVVYNADTPLYAKNHIIIKFNPLLVNTETINNTEITGSNAADFVNPLVFDLIAGTE